MYTLFIILVRLVFSWSCSVSFVTAARAVRLAAAPLLLLLLLLLLLRLLLLLLLLLLLVVMLLLLAAAARGAANRVAPTTVRKAL